MRLDYQGKSPAEKSLYRWRKSAKPPTPQSGSVRGQNPRLVALARAFCDWSDIEEEV